MANTRHIHDPFSDDSPLLPITKYSVPPGWRYTAYPFISEAGIAISKLVIEIDPSTGPAGIGITETVLRNISIPAVRSDVVESVERWRTKLEEALASMSLDDPSYSKWKELADEAAQVSDQQTPDQKRRVPLSKRRAWAQQAEQVVSAAKEARQQNSSIYAILEEEWHSGHELVKSRLRRLRDREYILGTGRNIAAGPLLTAWRRLTQNNQQEG